MNKIILLCLLMGAFCLCKAQTILIKDAENEQPLNQVTLVNELNNSIATNAQGQADITSFKDAAKIMIIMHGYQTETKSYAELAAAGFVLSLSIKGVTIDEVVLSATRWNQLSNKIPAKITLITPTEIAFQNPQTVADMLGFSGKVFIQKSQQGGGSPMIRGFATSRLLYAVDGVRMNTAIFRSGNIQNVISLDPFATEKAEVLFGPGSVIYGSDAIGGVMSFQTLTPQLSLTDKPLVSGKSIVRYASANQEKTAHFSVNIGGKKWAAVTSFSTNNFGNLRMGSNGPDEYLRPYYVQRQDSVDVIVTNNDPQEQNPTAYSQINMMQKVRFKPNKKWDIQYGFHYSLTSEYSRYDRHIRYKNGLPRYGEWYYGPQLWMMNNLHISHFADNKLYNQLTVRMAAQVFEESRIDRDINKTERHVRKEQVDAYSLNVDFSKNIAQKHKLLYGVETVTNQVKSTGVDENIVTGIKAIGPARYPQSNWASYAAYVNYKHELSEKWLLQAGLRYNLYQLNATFDTSFYPFPYTKANISNGALTGSFGIVFKPTKSWVLHANMSTGFRSPNVDDVGKVFDSEPGAVIIPNPYLMAEYAYNAEIGLTKVVGNWLKVDMAAYYTLLDKALVRRDFTLNGMDSIIYAGSLSKVQAIQNAAIATVYGVQLGIEIKLPSGFGFSTDYNFQVGEEELDNGTTSPSRHAAPAFGITRLNYTTGKLQYQIYANYSAAYTFDNLPQEEQGKPEIYAVDDKGKPWSPSWYTLNVKVAYQIMHQFMITAGLENLTDQRYKPYSSGMVAPGRNFILAIKANF